MSRKMGHGYISIYAKAYSFDFSGMDAICLWGLDLPFWVARGILDRPGNTNCHINFLTVILY